MTINKNSHRNHRNKIKHMLMDKSRADYEKVDLDEDVLNADMANLTDAIFEVLGITVDEQAMVGGYWMLHAGVKPPPKPEDLVPDEYGDFSGTLLTSGACRKSDDYEYSHTFGAAPSERRKQLDAGAKYTSGEFKGYCKSEWCDTYKVRLSIKTPVCTYAQVYVSDVSEDEARTRFVNFYYPMYLEDYNQAEKLKREANKVEEWAEAGKSGEGAEVAED